MLVLWDIDHTLIETRGAGGEFYRRAFEAATGVTMRRNAEVTGQTEPSILTSTLRLHDIDEDEPYLSRYKDALAAEYGGNRDELRTRGRVLPGAREALQALSVDPTVVQSVLTGNLRAVSEIKLHTFGLDRYVDLEVGAYGDDDTDRPSLVKIAQRRARHKYGEMFTRENTVVVGDSTHDIATGIQGGAATVAVASGSDEIETLTGAGAGAVLADLTDLARLRKVLHDIRA